MWQSTSAYTPHTDSWKHAQQQSHKHKLLRLANTEKNYAQLNVANIHLTFNSTDCLGRFKECFPENLLLNILLGLKGGSNSALYKRLCYFARRSNRLRVLKTKGVANEAHVYLHVRKR